MSVESVVRTHQRREALLTLQVAVAAGDVSPADVENILKAVDEIDARIAKLDEEEEKSKE